MLVRDRHGRGRQAVRVEGGGGQQEVGAARDGDGDRGRLPTTRDDVAVLRLHSGGRVKIKVEYGRHHPAAGVVLKGDC